MSSRLCLGAAVTVAPVTLRPLFRLKSKVKGLDCPLTSTSRCAGVSTVAAGCAVSTFAGLAALVVLAAALSVPAAPLALSAVVTLAASLAGAPPRLGNWMTVVGDEVVGTA